MPTYEYACRDCGQHLEVVQSFRDDALTECPNCQGSLRKVFSAAGIVFKGSGWHIKDYAASRPGAGRDKDGDSTVKIDATNDSPKSESSKSEGSKSDGPKSDRSKSDSSSGSERPSRTSDNPHASSRPKSTPEKKSA